MAGKLLNFHAVHEICSHIFPSNQRFLKKYACHSVEKSYKKRSRFLRKNQHFFRQINILLKKLIKSWFDGIFEHDRVF